MCERKYWRDYMRSFEDAIRATASEHAPWYVVPADNKWFTRLLVAAAIVGGGGAARPCLPEGERRAEEGAGGLRRGESLYANSDHHDSPKIDGRRHLVRKGSCDRKTCSSAKPEIFNLG